MLYFQAAFDREGRVRSPRPGVSRFKSNETTQSDHEGTLPVSNLEVNCRVRSVLVRHRVDLRRVEFGSFRGVVRVRGALLRLCCGSNVEFSSAHVEKLDTEISRIKGVNRVYFDLTNWRKDTSEQWQPVSQRTELEICEDVFPGGSPIVRKQGSPSSVD